MTGVGAAVRKAKVAAGANVVVIGCGAVGLNVIQGAKLVDAGQIIAVDVGDAKLDARSNSAPLTRSMRRSGDVVEQVKALTEGRGADYVFEAAGQAPTSAWRWKRCARAARWCGWARSTSTRR